MSSPSAVLSDLEVTTAYLVVRLESIAQATGLLQIKVASPFDPASAVQVLQEFAAAGVARVSSSRLDLSEPEESVALLRGALAAIEESPLPHLEWPSMTGLLGDVAVSRLVGASVSSVGRYRSGDRATPDDIAARLHLVTLVAADLLGSYNDFGVRRWFDRPRTQLDGRSPAEIFSGDWDPDGPEASRVRHLAAALIGSPVT